MWCRVLILLVLCNVLGCEDTRRFPADESWDRWEVRSRKECPCPEEGDVPDYILMLRILDESGLEFPWPQEHDEKGIPEEVAPTYIYKIVAAETFYSIAPPSRCTDGVLEFQDLLQGKTILLSPQIKITMVRVEELESDAATNEIKRLWRAEKLKWQQWEECWRQLRTVGEFPGDYLHPDYRPSF